MTDSRRVDLHGQRVSLYFNDELDHRALMEEVARQWRETLGLESDLVALPWDAYLTKGASGEGFGGPFRTSWELPYPSAQGYLQPLYWGRAIGRSNFARFSTKAFDDTLERKVVAEVGKDDRTTQLHRLENIACAEMPLIPLTFGQAEYLIRSDLLGSASGRMGDPSSGRLVLREVFRRR